MTSVCNGPLLLADAPVQPPVLRRLRARRRAAEDALRDSERRHRHRAAAPARRLGRPLDLDLRCLLLEGPHLEPPASTAPRWSAATCRRSSPPSCSPPPSRSSPTRSPGRTGSVEVRASLTGRTIVVQSAPVRAARRHASRGSSSSRATSPSSACAERAGREAERRFEIAFDRAPIGMALIGVDGSVERVNAALATITGRSAAELAALRHEELLHPDDEELAAEAFASLLADDGMATELRIVHADGHPVWVSLRATIVRDDEGTPVHVLVQVQDITERRSLEDQLRHLADHDALTGLLNRRGIDRALAQHVARGRRYGAEGALLVLDLDGFKAVNDSLGHAAGDELIVTCARALRQPPARDRHPRAPGRRRVRRPAPRRGRGGGAHRRAKHRRRHPRGRRRHRVGRRDAVRRRADAHQRHGPGRHGDVRRQAGAGATATSSRPARCPRPPESPRAGR